jgi:hypothetical protein
MSAGDGFDLGYLDFSDFGDRLGRPRLVDLRGGLGERRFSIGERDLGDRRLGRAVLDDLVDNLRGDHGLGDGLLPGSRAGGVVSAWRRAAKLATSTPEDGATSATSTPETGASSRRRRGRSTHS